jgi:cytochrome c551/c552
MKKLIVIIAISSGLLIASCGNQNGSSAPSGRAGENGTDNVVNDSGQTNNQTGDAPMGNDSFANSIPSGKIYDENSTPEERGAALIAGRNCKTCHNINGDNIGPSYQKVADKYGYTTAMVDELSLKIINGGSGRWGTVVMPPHHNVNTEEARAMAQYILSLSNKK